jgi:predicted Zn finger-like uncharacterized protein
VKFLCEQCKAKYQIADEKAVGKTVRMKCRKCGHLIEVRAAVTETSVSAPLPERAGIAGNPAIEGRAAAPPTLAGPFAGGAGSVKVAPRPERPPGALEGAFKTAVQNEATAAAAAAAPPRPQPRDEEHSTPFDMSDLSPSDEWYVAINGVPVGPIRVAEVRRKAALGAVTEDSLVWQEGLDEWRPLRSFPELATSVREAMTRLSRPPAGEMRVTAPPPPPSRAARSVTSSGSAPRAAPPRAPVAQAVSSPSAAASASVAPLARSNVVPIMSRLATAERLEPAPRHSPVPGPPAAPPQLIAPSVAPDPFAPASVTVAVQAPGSVPVPAQASAPVMAVPAAVSIAAPAAPKQVHWIPLAMVAMAIAFGITAAIAFVFRPTPQPTAAVAEPSTPVAPVAGPAATAAALPTATNDLAERAPAPSPTITRTAAPRAAAAPATNNAPAPATGRSLDLHALTQNGPGVTPTDDPGIDTPKAAGQSLTESQVQQVVGLHRTAINRGCWERNPTTKLAVNVNVTLTVAPDGSAQNVAATGDDPSVAKCIENDVRGWHFPASGSAQKMAIPFKFVRQ